MFIVLIGLYLLSANVPNGCLDSWVVSGTAVRCHILFTKIIVDGGEKDLFACYIHPVASTIQAFPIVLNY